MRQKENKVIVTFHLSLIHISANALSDIYAMGGEAKVALNIVAWPNCVNTAFLGKILEGGASKVAEAGAVLAGGHSVQDDEPKYGLKMCIRDRLLSGNHPGAL